MQNSVVWIIVAVFVLVILAFLIWYFWPSNNGNAEVIVIKKSKNVEANTPVLEGKPEETSEYIADEAVYSPNSTPVITNVMNEYAPVEEDDEEGPHITPGLESKKRN